MTTLNNLTNDQFVPISLSSDDVTELRRIIKEETGEEPTEGEARARATELIRLFRILVDPKASRQDTEVVRQPEVRPAVLDHLTDLNQSLILIRPRSKDWAWPVRAGVRLVSHALVAHIRSKQKRQPMSASAVPLDETDLPSLLRRVQCDGMLVSDSAVRTIDRLYRLARELKWITVDTWTILGDQLPRMLMEVVDLVAQLGRDKKEDLQTLRTDDHTAAGQLVEEIRDRMLIHEAERLK